jgi:DNA polymerase-3 subunit alpha
MDWVVERCHEEGVPQGDLDFLVDAIMGFAEYGFNRAHATVYGITAYRCAYLATHHAAEFHAGLLSVAAGNTKKEPIYLRATRARGVSVRKAVVNLSGVSYTIDPKRKNVIRKGLTSIPGVGEPTAEVLAANAPYKDLDDLIERTPARPVTGRKDYDGSPESLCGVLGKLRDSGALEEIGVSQ